jgi:hypothetical protein
VGSAVDILEMRDMVLNLSVRVMGLTAVDHIQMIRSTSGGDANIRTT